MLGTLDPSGLPLVSETLAGNGADDPIYVPAWKRLAQVIGHPDFVFIADAKAGAHQTRAQIDQLGSFYCVPLPQTGQIPQQLKHWIQHPPAVVEPLYLPTQNLDEAPLGQGFELELGQRWCDPKTQQSHHWMERYLVIQSTAQAQKQRASLQRRLEQAEQALQKLAAKSFQDECQLKHQQAAIVKQYRVSELFNRVIEPQTVTRYQGRGRPKVGDDSRQVVETRFQLKVQRHHEAIREAEQLLSWRIYVTNAPVPRLPRAQAVAYYRGQWQLERGYHRFKRGAIPALPIFLQNEQRIVGLMFLLTLALRVLALVEFRVRRELQQQQLTLAGLYAGNPKRQTQRPSTELLLQAFHGITLYHLPDGSRQITPLTPLQAKILALLHIPKTLYTLPEHALGPPAVA